MLRRVRVPGGASRKRGVAGAAASPALHRAVRRRLAAGVWKLSLSKAKREIFSSSPVLALLSSPLRPSSAGHAGRGREARAVKHWIQSDPLRRVPDRRKHLRRESTHPSADVKSSSMPAPAQAAPCRSPSQNPSRHPPLAWWLEVTLGRLKAKREPRAVCCHVLSWTRKLSWPQVVPVCHPWGATAGRCRSRLLYR